MNRGAMVVFLVSMWVMAALFYVFISGALGEMEESPCENVTSVAREVHYVTNHTIEYVVNHTVEYVHDRKPMRTPEMTGIAVLVPTTSRGAGPYCAHCLNVMSVAMRELVQTIPYDDKRFWYTVYVGYDDGDPMWDHEGRLTANLDVANGLFWRHPVTVKAVRIVRYPDPNKGSLTNVWNKLCAAALADNNKYVFLDNDDLLIESTDLFGKLVAALEANPLLPGLGESAPLDTSFTDTAHPTFPMVSTLHFEIFGQMYSTEIFSRGCDTWLGDVYRGFGSVLSLNDVKVQNTAYGTPRRYDNDFNDWRYRDLVVEGRQKISNFLHSRGVAGSWPTDLCGVSKTFGC